MQVYNFEQRMPEWYEIRRGKITASDIISILGKETLAKTQQSIENMALELAIESVHGAIDDGYINYDMQRGIDLEPYAFQSLKERLQLDFIELGKVGFIEYDSNIGCSPDGYVKRKLVAEIKAPNAKNFFKLSIKKEIDEKHIAQMQHQMFCADVDKCYYYAYCIHNGVPYAYLQIVNRDEDCIALIKNRCNIVIEKKLGYIEQLLKSGVLVDGAQLLAKENLQVK